MYFLVKSSVVFDNKFNYEADGKKYLITEGSSLHNKKVNDVIDENANKFHEISVFA